MKMKGAAGEDDDDDAHGRCDTRGKVKARGPGNLSATQVPPWQQQACVNKEHYPVSMLLKAALDEVYQYPAT
jgi:hypothetical protein